MPRPINLSDEEIAELKGILSRELDAARTELRRTENSEYHQSVAHRIEIVQHMFDAIQQMGSKISAA